MKMTKKILSVLLAVVLMIAPATAGITASAAADMTFSVSKIRQAKPGDIVTFEVTLKNSKKVCVVNPTVEYDASMLEFVSAENGDVFQKNAFFIGEAHEGKVRILYYNGVRDVKKDGVMCKLKFKVLDDASGYAFVKLDFPENSVVDSKEKAVSFKNVEGRVGVISAAIFPGETAKPENSIDEIYYQKVPLFASYKDQSVILTAGVIGETVKKVEWSVGSTNRLVIAEAYQADNGRYCCKVVPNRIWYCRDTITAKVTTIEGEVFEKTIKVEFFKLEITKYLPVF